LSWGISDKSWRVIFDIGLWIFHWRVGFPFSIAATIVSIGGHPSSVHSNSITLTTESSAIGKSSYAKFLIRRIKPTSLLGRSNNISKNTFFCSETKFYQKTKKNINANYLFYATTERDCMHTSKFVSDRITGLEKYSPCLS